MIPVLGSAAGVGASVFALSLFDALDGAGVRTLLVDTADPARSGLSAISDQGPVVRQPADDLAICASRRGGGFVLRLAAPSAGVFRASMVPAPQWWLPQNRAPEVTIVDLGWDPWPLVDHPLRGPAAWLRASDGGDEVGPWPVLVCAPTRPSVTRANQVLARLRSWNVAGGVSEVAGLVVSGAARWPRGVGGVVGPRLAGLEPPYFLPHDRRIAVGGLSTNPMPARMQRVAGRLADAWGLQ